MANANISHVTLINTFSDWRGATNDLANSANDLRNGNYLREAGAILNIKNGALYVDRQTGVTFNVTANANVENNLTTKTKIVLDEAIYNGDDARFTNTNVIVQVANTLATKNLISNSFIHSQNTITTDLIVGSDSSGMCWIQGDPYPSKTPIYIEGNFGAIDRGFNLYGNSISSVIVTANVANTKILDIDIDVQVPDGPGGVKGQKGQKGQPGVQGAQGVQGFAGLSGHQGVQGAQGLAGLKGDVGEVVGGTKGAKGDKGEFGYGEVGDDGEKGQKGESIGATKGEKGAKGEKGGLGDAGVNASTPSKGDTGDSGLSGDIGDVGLNVEFVRGYANFGGGFAGFFAPTIFASNNISSISISNQSWAGGTIRLYTLNFTNPLPSSSYSVVGSSRKPNSSETGFFYSGSGHLQTYLKDTNYTQVAFAVSGENINNTQYFIPADGSVIIVGDIVAASSVEITNVTASNFSLAGIGGSATATYRLASSGGAFRTISSGTLTAISGQWLLSGSASNYEAFVSVNSGGTGTPGGTFDTWVNLGTTQNWTLTSENSFSTTTFTVQIRNAATLAVVDTAQVTMEVDSAP
jgi:hypothetical protein